MSFDATVAPILDQSRSPIRGPASHLDDRQSSLETCESGAENGFRQVGILNRLVLLALSPPTDLADKTGRGLRGRIEVGKSGGDHAYGYRVVHALGSDGRPIRGDRKIDSEQATVVCRIFEDYAAGLSPRSIALSLNREGIEGPTGKAAAESNPAWRKFSGSPSATPEPPAMGVWSAAAALMVSRLSSVMASTTGLVLHLSATTTESTSPQRIGEIGCAGKVVGDRAECHWT